jgi:hypothetical protein
MDFDTEEKINEDELDALNLKKKADELLDVDGAEDPDDTADDTDLVDEDKEKDATDEGLFGDDKELEEYMLAGYDENN